MLTRSILQITKSYHGHDGITQLNPLCALKLRFKLGENIYFLTIEGGNLIAFFLRLSTSVAARHAKGSACF